MSDEVILDGKHYISSKRASDLSGYARDYIGQLSRGGLIDAQRVGGLWYVNMDSLNSYKKNADSYVPVPPVGIATQDSAETIVSFDGKEYVSASKAAKITSYNQDYIGQLARSGKILSRQVGNRWYVEKKGLQEHKAQKDSMLASVRSEAVGLRISSPVASMEADIDVQRTYTPVLTYTHEENDLLPALRNRPSAQEEVPKFEIPSRNSAVTRSIPIRVVNPRPKIRHTPTHTKLRSSTDRVRTSRMTISRAINSAVALTFVIVLSYGFVSLKQGSLYTLTGSDAARVLKPQTLSASAAEAFDTLGSFIESWLAPEVHYDRK